MKRILILFSAVLLMCSILDAQPPASIIPVTADPSGSCFAPVPMQFNSVNGKYWGCVAGTWTQITGGGGGSGTVTQVDTGSCLKGGPITTTGTVALDGAVNPQTSTYQALAADFSACKTITVASGTFTITLVASGSQPAAGQSINIINYGSGTVTIARSGQNINGGTSSLTLGPGSATSPSAATVKSDGTNYFAVVGSSFPATTCTNQVITALAAGTAAGTCTSLTTAYLPASATLTIASGTSALGTSSISTASCATVVTTTATGVTSTDAIQWTPNGSIKAVTGYVPATTGGLTIAAYPTADNVNFDVCNWTSGSITPGAVTINWRVVR